MSMSMKEIKAMKRFVYCIVGLGFASSLLSCEAAEKLAEQCGLACPGGEGPDGVEIKGVLEGNAAISGVAQVDAFFAAVNNFRGAADGVSAGIEAELDKIRADFGLEAGANVAAGIRGQVMTNIEGSVSINYQPPRCSVDAEATVEAKARCEAEVMPPTVELECKGSCQLEAEAKLECDASAELECTFTGVKAECNAECAGTCEVELSAAARCDGTCTGTCSGDCSAYSDASGSRANCAGACDGMCMGRCEAKAEAGVKCMGTCRGECTVSGPEAMCEGSARASCKAKANASVMCKGKCEGDFEPPSASAECEASARAEAKINVQCTPPSVAASYRLKAVASAEVEAQLRFEAAIKTLIRVRLPALVAVTARAKLVGSAGADLADAARVAVKASVRTAADGDASIRAKAGLLCAVGQLDEVEMAVDDAVEQLNGSLEASAAIQDVFEMS